MEGVSIIETQTILTWEKRFINMENLLMELLKLNKQAVPNNLQHSVPDFITIEKIIKKDRCISRQPSKREPKSHFTSKLMLLIEESTL